MTSMAHQSDLHPESLHTIFCSSRKIVIAFVELCPDGSFPRILGNKGDFWYDNFFIFYFYHICNYEGAWVLVCVLQPLLYTVMAVDLVS